MEKKTYTQRWIDLAERLVAHKGRAATIGFLLGIIVNRTQVDYDLKDLLDRLEDRYR